MLIPNPDPFQAIADRSRREILMLISKERLPINQVAENFEISRPAISKHIKVLCEARLVTITTYGRERYCELNEQGFNEIREWLSYYDQFWQEKLQGLEDLLKQRSKNKNNESN
ncbi:ArsR/SmtB family transcription factor [Hufsiella ginkgonis]|uniref:Metalloregulator ArsR/SmtB family transcription factor n=1 Tax=Hufsiella ginkgonis TaxID=2695274 RepID=A0A7K1XS03_9SPHI|nr:metalloregulator ArsR/SmtB family transcription factor [Hufsiella ginkgonis]MXV13758.1 metalloregulator ArsR/SmtB family transcription factor [Hufsiella ginkgonis]